MKPRLLAYSWTALTKLKLQVQSACSWQRSSKQGGSEWEIWSQTALDQVLALVTYLLWSLGQAASPSCASLSHLRNGDDDGDRMYILETIWTINALICVKCWLHLNTCVVLLSVHNQREVLCYTATFCSLFELNRNHWSSGRLKRACGCATRWYYWKNSPSEHSDVKSVAGTQTPNFWWQGTQDVAFFLKGSNHLSKGLQVVITSWLELAFEKIKALSILHLVNSVCNSWGLWSGRFSNLFTPSLLINIRADSFLNSYSWPVLGEHLKCKYTCQLLLSIVFSWNDMPMPR